MKNLTHPYNIKIIPFLLQKSEFLDFCHVFSDEIGTCVFYSGGIHDTAKISYLCLYPLESFWICEKTLYHLEPTNPVPNVEQFENPWDALKQFVSESHDGFQPVPDWVGYLGYEMGGFVDLEKKIPYQDPGIPDTYFFRPSVILALDHLQGTLTLYLREENLPFLSDDQRQIIASLEIHEKFQEILIAGKKRAFSQIETNICSHHAVESYESYSKKIERAKEFIRAGEIYQINLSQKFHLKGTCSPYNTMRKIAAINPAPYMVYFNFPQFSVVSSSPELFLCKEGNRLETRPIKGTMPRGMNPREDLENKNALLNSEKDKAELLMITDLMRNDLGKVSYSGSVVTDKIGCCEEYANVFHLNSIIHSRAKSSLNPVDIIKMTFPAGSITGCPKLRAMEMIYDLEKRPRGIYTGSIGYFAINGDFNFNVAIRSILFKGDEMEFSLGGAIISDSITEKEYQETLHKGASIFQALSCKTLFVDKY